MASGANLVDYIILIRICDPHTEQLQLTPAQGELITALRVQLLITALG